ncbi:Protein SABRE [Umbelopsis sp. WA50703]
MATWLTRVAIACFALIIARFIVHIILALRYNFEYAHLGFLSISGIKYHLRVHLDDNVSRRSVTFKVGKVKLRLRHHFFQSRADNEQQSAFVTLHIQDVEVVVHDLALLHRHGLQKQDSKEEQARRGSSLASVGESLTRIPWWYSLSIVKWVIRTTSAIPAQLVISGLAQYADVRVERLQVKMINVAAFEVENVTLSSMLFADVKQEHSGSSSSTIERDRLADPSMLLQEILINAQHQQHSFKKANHLWKEKFLEVNAAVGPIRIWHVPDDADSSISAALSFPALSHLALSCHLSAACTTLKDVSLDVRLQSCDVDADAIIAILQRAKQQNPKISANADTQAQSEGTENDYSHKRLSSGGLHRSGAIHTHRRTASSESTSRSNHKAGSKSLLLKSSTLSISSVEISKRICSSCSSSEDERLVLAIDKASIGFIRDQCHQDVDLQGFPHSANMSTMGIEVYLLPSAEDKLASRIFSITQIEASLFATESVLLNKKQALTTQIVDTFATDHDHATEDPNTQLVKGNFDILSPIISLDLQHISSFNQIIDSFAKTDSQPKQQIGAKQMKWQIQNIPRFALALSVNSPKLFITNLAVLNSSQDFLPAFTGIAMQEIQISLRGNYVQVCEGSMSPSLGSPIGSPLGSPTHVPDSFMSSLSPSTSPPSTPITTTRPPSTSRWKTLLRRSWRSSAKSPSLAISSKNWSFDTITSVRFIGCSPLLPELQENIKKISKPTLDNTLLFVDEIIVSARTSVNSTIAAHHRRQPPSMCIHIDNPQIEFCLSVNEPRINLWSMYNNQKQLSILQTMISGMKFTKQLSKPHIEVTDTDKNPKAFKPPVFFQNSNITFAIQNVSIGVVGTDAGIRGTRKIPEGYIDNAPSTDTHLGLVLYLESLSICYKFHGASSDRTESEAILEKPDNESYLGAADIFLSGAGLSPCVGLSSGQVLVLAGLGGERECFVHLSQVDARTIIRSRSQGGCTFISPKVSVSFGRSLVFYTLQNHYATLLVMLTLKNSLLKSSEPVTPKNTENKFKLELDKCKVALHHMDVRALLPGELNLFMRIRDLRFDLPLNNLKREIQVRSIRLFGISPQNTSSWDELIGIDNLSVVQQSKGNENNVVIFSQGVHVCIPFNYVVANIIDNALNTFKSLKLLTGRLFSDKYFDWRGPIPKDKPIYMPRIQLQFEILTFAIEDDPFEGCLRLIYNTGTLQQKTRLANEEAFMAKAQSVEEEQAQRDDQSGRRALDGEQVRDGFLNGSNSRPKAASYSSRMSSIPQEFGTGKSNISVNLAWNRLQEHNTNVWIRAIRNAKREEEEGVKRQCESRRQHQHKVDHSFGQRSLEFTSMYLSDLFDIKLVDPPKHPSLLFSAMRCMNLIISPPEFPLEETRLFMQKIGDGVPLNTEFSTLAPFHLSWFADETWVQLRDYPLPLLYVPPSAKTESEHWPRAWSLSGDYVFGDELGTKLATRTVNVTMLDIQNCQKYQMSVPRTSSPPKFYSVVEIECLCSNPVRMSWATSMQPTIQDVSRTFELFTRPSVDPSEKLGFWDKMRLMIHTRTRIRFAGDFAVCLKGTRDPYNLLGKGAGFVKIWSKEVQWLVGYQNSQREFMQILSQDYILAVPDLVNGSYVVKHILPIDKDDSKNHRRQRSETNHGEMTIKPKSSGEMRRNRATESGTKSLYSTSAPEFQVNMPKGARARTTSATMSLKNGFERKDLQKIGLKLSGGVRWGNYDAFAGFRSHFIHFSISIVQDTNSSHATEVVNAVHLSPGFADHFLQWFRLFGGGMGLPTRAGPLFPKADNRPSKKFGKHMSTVKYKIVTNHLSIGWFEKDEQSMYSVNGTGETLGFKASVSSFKFDLHQRRIVSKYDSEKFGRERIKPHWVLNEAQVQVSDVDLRVVKAIYPNIVHSDESDSGRTTAAPSLVIDETSTLNSDTSQAYMSSSGSEDGDTYMHSETMSTDWFDVDDYVELDIRTPDFRPSVNVFPMMFSPSICYFKQTNRDDTERYQYLHETHECIFGSALDTRATQVSLLKQRMEAIDVQIRNHQQRLEDVEQRLKKLPFESELLSESESIVEKTTVLFEKKSLLQRYLKSVLTQNMPDLPRTTSTGRHLLPENDPTDRWEALMGYFKQRCIVHNAQIIWNNSVRNLVYRLLDVHAQQRAHKYYMSMRAVKFLRDLTVDTKSKLNVKSPTPADGEADQALDMQMAKDLIEQLLAEQSNSSVPTAMDDSDSTSNDADVTLVDSNLNDPDYQRRGIPSGYDMKSSYIVELLNPQISLQSDKSPDSIVLVSTERTQLKGFNILDCSEDDFDTAVVKNRTLFSVDNIQFFVAKKAHFDTVDLLFDNHYGARGNEHWLTWIPLEMLINYTKRSDKFQRVADRAAASMQYDTYNPLRLKTNQAVFNRVHPLEERCDSVAVSFPSLLLTANSAQFNAIVDVVVDLLLYSEPARKERLERLQEIMMTVDMDNLMYATDTIIFLQNTIRQIATTQEQYRLSLAELSELQMQEYKLIMTSLLHYKEELYLVMEALKKNPGGKQDSKDANETKLKLNFSAQKIIWEMIIESDRTLCEWTLNNARYVWLSKEDHSSANTLELDMIQCINRLPNPTFAEIISPYLEHRKQIDFSRNKMLRGYLHDLPPVGGIPVVQHLEINLFPLKFQMTQEFGKLLASYVFPVEKRKSHQSSPSPIPISTSASAPNVASSTISSRSGSSEPTPHTLSITSMSDLRSSSAREFSPLSTSSEFAASDIHLEAAKSDTLRPKRSDEHLSSSLTVGSPSKRSGIKKHNKNSSATSVPNADDLSVMKERASSNRTFIYIKVPGAKHCLSYQGPKEKNIEDLYDFVFTQPTLEYRNRTWSWYELMNAVKKDILRAALKHSGQLLRDKLKIRRHPRGPRIIPTTAPFATLATEPMYQKALAAASASELLKPSTNSTISIATESSDGYDDQDDALANDASSIDTTSDIIGEMEGVPQRKKRQLFSSWARGSSKKDKVPSPSATPTSHAESEDSRSSFQKSEIQQKGKLLFGKSYSGISRTGTPSHSRSTTNSD